jgi:Uma2 family endonuclease
VSDPVPLPAHMTADEFIDWAMNQPETEHYELAGGEVIAMAPERLTHARAKLHITNRLNAAIDAAGADCEAIIDGPAVVVDPATVYEPDAMVRCGPDLDGEAVRISDPVIVVEVLSRSTKGRDTGAKLADYFRLPSVRHYLIVRAEDRIIIHHARTGDGPILTRILRDGPIALDPPGITLTEPFSPKT